jgi:hypothetical protein
VVVVLGCHGLSCWIRLIRLIHLIRLIRLIQGEVVVVVSIIETEHIGCHVQFVSIRFNLFQFV